MEKLRQIFKNMKIKSKLFIVYFFTMSSTVAIIYSVSAIKINGILLEQASNSLSASTLQIKDNIFNFTSSYEQATDNIVLNQTFISNISHPPDTSTAEYDRTKQARNVLDLLQNNYPAISNIKVYMLQDTVLFDGKVFIKYDSDVVSQMDSSDAWIEWTGRRLGTGDLSVVTLYRTIYNYPLDAKQIGVLSVEIRESEFYEFIKKESLNKSIVIFNDKGEVVTYGGDFLIEDMEIILSNLTSADFQGQTEFKKEDENYIMYYATADNGWTVASYIPITSLFSTMIGLNRYVIIVILISVAVFLILATILLNLLMKRISQFTQAAYCVGEGQYDISLDFAGKDEIGQLADSFNKMVGKLDVLFNDVYLAQIKQKEAELLALQAQINPHFLYNVLSSLGYAALKKNAPEIRDTLMNLSEFYRFSLSQANSLVSLEEEIAQVKTYISIQKIRFGDMLAVFYDIPKEVLKTKMLRLTLQPFVENAINHASRDGGTKLTIKIAAKFSKDLVHIDISDNGIGIPEDKLKEIQLKINSGIDGKHYGIQNVHSRIRLFFGEEYGVSIDSALSKGTVISITVPSNE